MNARRPDENESTSSRLLSVSAELFRKNGFDATSTRELSEHLGIQISSLYYHIRSKTDLLFNISMTALRHITAALEEVITDDSFASANAEERMRRVIHSHLTTALSDRDMHATMLSDMRALPEKERLLVVQARDAYERLVRGVIASAQQEGALRRDADPKLLTLALLNLLNWTIFWFDPEGELRVSDFAGLLADVYLQGTLTDSARGLNLEAVQRLTNG